MYFIPIYILILIFTIVVDYAAGILVERATGRGRLFWLGASIAANVGVLAVFKYYNFFDANLVALTHALGWNYSSHALAIILPIGLSFHTFQAMSYTIEVYRGNTPAERHFGIYALYVLFYPQLVAGPIERPQNLMHQFRERHDFNALQAASGFRLMLWGMFKKSFVADRLAGTVAAVYAAPEHFSGRIHVLACFFFAIQIYCDFSGYSDIAIGAARVMGFTLMRNFERPYLATSISEFWRRWHVSLSSWFRDYVFIPLGGSKAGVVRSSMNLLIVFLLSGLWHGANWTYVIWGGLNGLYLIAGKFAGTGRTRAQDPTAAPVDSILRRLVQCLFVFVLVCIGWIFFRAVSLHDAATVFRQIFCHWGNSKSIQAELAHAGTPMRSLALGVAGIAIVVMADVMIEFKVLPGLFETRPPWQRMVLYYAGAAAVLFFGVFGSEQFIYFQF